MEVACNLFTRHANPQLLMHGRKELVFLFFSFSLLYFFPLLFLKRMCACVCSPFIESACDMKIERPRKLRLDLFDALKMALDLTDLTRLLPVARSVRNER